MELALQSRAIIIVARRPASLALQAMNRPFLFRIPQSPSPGDIVVPLSINRHRHILSPNRFITAVLEKVTCLSIGVRVVKVGRYRFSRYKASSRHKNPCPTRLSCD